jgi:hypothetical protein
MVVVREVLISGVVVFLYWSEGWSTPSAIWRSTMGNTSSDAEQTWGVFAGGALAMLGYVVATQ